LEQVKEMKLGGYFLLIKRLFINILFSFPYCYKGMKLATLFNFLLKLSNGPEYDHLKICIKKFDLFKNFFISFIFFIKSVVFKKKNKIRYRAQHDAKWHRFRITKSIKFLNKNKIRINVGKMEQKQNYNKNLKT